MITEIYVIIPDLSQRYIFRELLVIVAITLNWTYETNSFVGLHIQVDVEASFPRHWNDHQSWQCDIRASKASLFLIFHHKHFFVGKDYKSKCF